MCRCLNNLTVFLRRIALIVYQEFIFCNQSLLGESDNSRHAEDIGTNHFVYSKNRFFKNYF